VQLDLVLAGPVVEEMRHQNNVVVDAVLGLLRGESDVPPVLLEVLCHHVKLHMLRVVSEALDNLLVSRAVAEAELPKHIV